MSENQTETMKLGSVEFITGCFSDFRNALYTFNEQFNKLQSSHLMTEYQKNKAIGEAMSDLARSYSDGVMALSEGWYGTPAERQMMKDMGTDIMRNIENIRQSGSDAYAKAGQQFSSAMKAAATAKAAGVAGAVVSVAELGVAAKEAKDTGNYDNFGETASRLLGTLAFGEAGVWAGTGLVAALVALGILSTGVGVIPFAIVAAVAVGFGLIGDKLGKEAWGGFKLVSDWLSDKFSDWFGINRTGLFHIYDPLVLDLDGDGIELVNANGWNGVQFDYNGNGIQTATQWVKPDDGLLVWDRNNNGVIDDGSELFGQDTPHRFITEPVTDGFTALRTVESHPDGEINAKDHEWKNLKVWRDLNQDGKTQKGELFSLNELGITGLDLNTGLTKGTSTFTTQDGKKQKLADVNFNRDTVHSEYKEHIALTEEQLKLPNLHGVGMLRDLREAANSEFFAQYTTAFQAA